MTEKNSPTELDEGSLHSNDFDQPSRSSDCSGMILSEQEANDQRNALLEKQRREAKEKTQCSELRSKLSKVYESCCKSYGESTDELREAHSRIIEDLTHGAEVESLTMNTWDDLRDSWADISKGLETFAPSDSKERFLEAFQPYAQACAEAIEADDKMIDEVHMSKGDVSEKDP